MKLSAKARYGLYAMVHLAKKHEQGVVSIAELSQAINVSQKYLEQVLSALKGKGMVESMRGASGGYSLSASPSEISVGEVVRAVENDLRIVDCLDGNCKNSCTCGQVWSNLYDKINEYLNSISLQQLISNDAEKPK